MDEKVEDLIMMAVATSEKPVNFYETTRGNMPKDGHLHFHRH
jgi:hypothetical protein